MGPKNIRRRPSVCNECCAYGACFRRACVRERAPAPELERRLGVQTAPRTTQRCRLRPRLRRTPPPCFSLEVNSDPRDALATIPHEDQMFALSRGDSGVRFEEVPGTTGIAIYEMNAGKPNRF